MLLKNGTIVTGCLGNQTQKSSYFKEVTTMEKYEDNAYEYYDEYDELLTQVANEGPIFVDTEMDNEPAPEDIYGYRAAIQKSLAR